MYLEDDSSIILYAKYRKKHYVWECSTLSTGVKNCGPWLGRKCYLVFFYLKKEISQGVHTFRDIKYDLGVWFNFIIQLTTQATFLNHKIWWFFLLVASFEIKISLKQFRKEFLQTQITVWIKDMIMREGHKVKERGNRER